MTMRRSPKTRRFLSRADARFMRNTIGELDRIDRAEAAYLAEKPATQTYAELLARRNAKPA